MENQALDITLSEEPCDEMDEDEWSDINFGNSFTVENESRFLYTHFYILEVMKCDTKTRFLYILVKTVMGKKVHLTMNIQKL